MSDKTIFDYSVTPNTVYITVDKDNRSIARVNIGVVNNTDDYVICDELNFIIVVGEEAGALTSVPGSIALSSSQPDKWSFVPVQGAPGQFRAEPVVSGSGLAKGDAVGFQISNIVVSGVVGATRIDIIEKTNDGRRDDAKTLNKIRPDLRIESFTANPISIELGGSTNLQWATQGAGRCTLTKGSFAPEEVNVTGLKPVSPTDTTLYTLNAFGGIGGQLQAVAHVLVARARILEFRGPTIRIAPGGEARLVWRTEHAVRCELAADGIVIDSNAPFETQARPYLVTPKKEATRYSLFAYNKDGSHDHRELTVFLQPRFHLSLGEVWKTNLKSPMIHITTPRFPPNDPRIFVSSYGGDSKNNLDVLDLVSRKSIFNTSSPASGYYQLELSPNSKKLFAENMMSIALFNATPESSYSRIGHYNAGSFIPIAVAFHPDGTKIYLSSGAPKVETEEALETEKTSSGANPVRHGINIFSATDLKFLDSIPVGEMPGGTAISPDGKTLCCIEMKSASLYMIDLETKQVSTINVGTDSRVYRIVNAVWSHDGTKIYATNCTPGTVWVVNAATKAVSKIDLGANVTPAILRLGPKIPDFDEASNILYALCGPDGTVAGISTTRSNDEVVSRFSLQQQSNPAFQFKLDVQKIADWPVMAIAPDGRGVYVSNSTDNSIFIISNGWPKAAKALREMSAAQQETVFDYILSPTTVYTTRDPMNPSVIKLDIGVSNNKDDDIECDWIGFIVTKSLTSDFNSISASSSRPDEWAITPIQGAPGQFRASPIEPNTGLKAGGGVSFQLTNIIVDEEVGPARFEIVEMVGEPREDAIGINKIRADLNIDYFRVQPPVIKSGGASVLSWKTTAAARCILSWRTGCKEVELTGTEEVKPLETTIYTLTAKGGLGPDVSDQKAVVVNSVIINFDATPIVVGMNGTSVLSWQILNSDPDTCILNPGELKVDPTGSKIINLKETSTTYSLRARGGASSDLKQITVDVARPLIRRFDATTPEKFGDPVTLTWDVLYATSVSIDQGIGQVLPSGSTVVSNPNKTTYTLTCLGLGEPVKAHVTVPGRQVKILYIYNKCIDTPYSCSERFFGVRCTCVWETELATSTQLIRVKDNMVVATRSGDFVYNSWAPAAGKEDQFKLVAEGPGGLAISFIWLGWWPPSS